MSAHIFIVGHLRCCEDVVQTRSCLVGFDRETTAACTDKLYEELSILLDVEDALGRNLGKADIVALKSHPLLRTNADGSFVFRFAYLAQFAPAVWLCDYMVTNRRDFVVEKYLGSIAGKSSP